MDCSTVRGLTNAAATVCIEQPPDWRTYITPFLVFISACIAFLAIRNARAVARQKATLDLIEKTESTDHYRDISQKFSALRRSDGLVRLNNPTTEADRKARRCVLDYLNHYELVAIGILEDILDEKFTVRGWRALSSATERRGRLDPARAVEATRRRQLVLLSKTLRTLSGGGVQLVHGGGWAGPVVQWPARGGGSRRPGR